MAHRPWMSSASLYHFRNAGSLPRPNGSNPKSPGSLPIKPLGVKQIATAFNCRDPRFLGSSSSNNNKPPNTTTNGGVNGCRQRMGPLGTGQEGRSEPV
ncbi:hypothetical protein HanPSC8_Chr10g0428111 [Helianthus annuus]|nr:hypothetical protein HanPSC8_Chr10g0428111 [Helianthus annuus]